MQYRRIYGSTAISKQLQDITWPTHGRAAVRPETHGRKPGFARPYPSSVMRLILRDGCGDVYDP
jgi:hypothetical protein